MNNEPVAWWDGKEPSVLGLSYFKNDYCPIPLYTHPAKTLKQIKGINYWADAEPKTLTDEEIEKIWQEGWAYFSTDLINYKSFQIGAD